MKKLVFLLIFYSTTYIHSMEPEQPNCFDCLPDDIILEIAQYLLNDPNDKKTIKSTLALASTCKRLRSVIQNSNAIIDMISTKLQIPPIHIAVALQATAWLSENIKNYDVNAKGNHDCTPLYVAVSNNSVNMVCLLIACGASVNREDNLYKYTPLHIAASYDSFNITHLLLSNGAAVDAQDVFNDTPLHRAAIFNSVSAAHLLLDNRATVDAKNCFNETPLYHTAGKNSANVARLLLEWGADLTIQGTNLTAKGCEYKTPLEIAKDKNNKEMIELLEQAEKQQRQTSSQS